MERHHTFAMAAAASCVALALATGCTQGGGQTAQGDGAGASQSVQTEQKAVRADMSRKDVLRRATALLADDFWSNKREDVAIGGQEDGVASCEVEDDSGRTISKVHVFKKNDGGWLVYAHKYVVGECYVRDVVSQFYGYEPGADVLSPVDRPYPKPTQETLVDYLTMPDVVGRASTQMDFESLGDCNTYTVECGGDELVVELQYRDDETERPAPVQSLRYRWDGERFVELHKAGEKRIIGNGCFGGLCVGGDMPDKVPGYTLTRSGGKGSPVSHTYSKDGQKVLEVIGSEGTVLAIRCFSADYSDEDNGFGVGTEVGEILGKRGEYCMVYPVMAEGEHITGARVEYRGDVSFYFNHKGLVGGKPENESEVDGQIVGAKIARGTLVTMVELR